MTFFAAALLLVLIAVAIVQITSSVSLACHPDVAAEKRLNVLLSMIFYCINGLGLFVLAAARFAELMLA